MRSILKFFKSLFCNGNGYHHIISIDGTDGFIMRLSDGGNKITVGGWNSDHWSYRKGDLVLLEMRDGQRTRYKIETVKHCGDPSDQYFIDCTFYPRQPKGEV
jgi:hypothetical protein